MNVVVYIHLIFPDQRTLDHILFVVLDLAGYRRLPEFLEISLLLFRVARERLCLGGRSVRVGSRLDESPLLTRIERPLFSSQHKQRLVDIQKVIETIHC